MDDVALTWFWSPCYSDNICITQSSAGLISELIFVLSYIKGGIQAKGISKQDSEANIWAQKGWEWGVEKAPQWGTS